MTQIVPDPRGVIDYGDVDFNQDADYFQKLKSTLRQSNILRLEQAVGITPFQNRLNDAYGGRPVITYRDLDAPRDFDEF